MWNTPRKLRFSTFGLSLPMLAKRKTIPTPNKKHVLQKVMYFINVMMEEWLILWLIPTVKIISPCDYNQYLLAHFSGFRGNRYISFNPNIRSSLPSCGRMVQLFGLVPFNYILPDRRGVKCQLIYWVLKKSTCLLFIKFILSNWHWFTLDLLIYLGILPKPTSTKTSLSLL